MLQRIAAALALLLVLLTCAALAEEIPLPYTGELTGSWGFCGGAEEMGDGFRLNEDGTGTYLEIIDYEQVPPQYRDTPNAFTWTAEYTPDKTRLHLTDADGRAYTREVETWGDSRIHIPNEVSGSFYYPVLDDALRADLAGKTEPTAFDGVLADYLDGAITRNIKATGLQVGELYLQQSQGEWQITFIAYDRERGLEARFILREDDIRIWVDKWVYLWSDFDLGQPWFAPHRTEDYYTLLPGILDSYVMWEYAPQPTPEPEPPMLPELTGRLGVFPKNQTYPVYEVYIAEGEDNRQSGNGKAKVSTNGDIWVYALWRGKLLVKYELGGGRWRIGWIPTELLPESTLAGIPTLPDGWNPEEVVYGVVTQDTWLTDDPHYDGIDASLTAIPAPTSVRCLGRLGDNLLVEAFIDRELRLGLIPSAHVALDEGYAGEAVYVIGPTSRFTEQDVRSAMNAVAACIEEDWPGTGLMEIRYIEEESADPDAWWQDESGQLTGILLYADLNSIELHDYEIAGAAIARDYQFILYREAGGEWYIGNWGYT